MGKHAAGIGIIGGSDGPTSIFMAGKRRFSLRLMRRRRMIARIRRRVKPDPHTVEELIAYIEKKYGARRLAEDSISFKEQYRCARAALVMQERPELLKLPVPEFPSVDRKNPDRKALEDYFARTERHICEIKRALDVDKARATFVHMTGGASVIARDSRAGAGGCVCALMCAKPIAGENLCGADGEAGEGREGREREENGRIRALIMR